MTTYSFYSELVQAQCPCHHGKFRHVVIALQPDHPPMTIGTSPWFDTEAEATKDVDKIIMAIVTPFLNALGLDPEKAASKTVVSGEAADFAIEKAIRESNPALH